MKVNGMTLGRTRCYLGKKGVTIGEFFCLVLEDCDKREHLVGARDDTVVVKIHFPNGVIMTISGENLTIRLRLSLRARSSTTVSGHRRGRSLPVHKKPISQILIRTVATGCEFPNIDAMLFPCSCALYDSHNNNAL